MTSEKDFCEEWSYVLYSKKREPANCPKPNTMLRNRLKFKGLHCSRSGSCSVNIVCPNANLTVEVAGWMQLIVRHMHFRQASHMSSTLKEVCIDRVENSNCVWRRPVVYMPKGISGIYTSPCKDNGISDWSHAFAQSDPLRKFGFQGYVHVFVDSCYENDEELYDLVIICTAVFIIPFLHLSYDSLPLICILACLLEPTQIELKRLLITLDMPDKNSQSTISVNHIFVTATAVLVKPESVSMHDSPWFPHFDITHVCLNYYPFDCGNNIISSSDLLAHSCNLLLIGNCFALSARFGGHWIVCTHCLCSIPKGSESFRHSALELPRADTPAETSTFGLSSAFFLNLLLKKK